MEETLKICQGDLAKTKEAVGVAVKPKANAASGNAEKPVIPVDDQNQPRQSQDSAKAQPKLKFEESENKIAAANPDATQVPAEIDIHNEDEEEADLSESQRQAAQLPDVNPGAIKVDQVAMQGKTGFDFK